MFRNGLEEVGKAAESGQLAPGYLGLETSNSGQLVTIFRHCGAGRAGSTKVAPESRDGAPREETRAGQAGCEGVFCSIALDGLFVHAVADHVIENHGDLTSTRKCLSDLSLGSSTGAPASTSN